MTQLNNIEYWKNQLGLLPINLFSVGQNKKFILLNGGNGDFCIDLLSVKDQDDYFSYAWSSNTKSFITLKNEKNVLYNWLKGKEEQYELNFVSQQLEKFYAYLLHNSYKSEYDIVPFIIHIYKSLRNLTNEPEEGIQALNYLLLLLAAYCDNCDLNKVDLNKWNIPDKGITRELDNYLDEKTLLHK